MFHDRNRLFGGKKLTPDYPRIALFSCELVSTPRSRYCILMVVLVCNSDPVDVKPKCDHSNGSCCSVISNDGIGL